LSSSQCIVNTVGGPVREIAVLGAADDAAATVEARALAGRWPRFETVLIYDGERLVAVVGNPSVGLLTDFLARRPGRRDPRNFSDVARHAGVICGRAETRFPSAS
jgi:hypothetical protein